METGVYVRSIVIGFWIFSGCVTIHRVIAVPPVRKQLAKTAGQANKLFRGIHEGRLQRQRLLGKLYAEGASRAQAPYKTLQNHLSALAKVTREVKASHDLLQRHRQVFLSVTKGRKRIRSDNPRYAKVHGLVDQVKAELAILQGLAKKAKAQAAKFDRLAKKNRIGEIDAAKLSAQLQKQIRQTRTEMTQFNSTLKQARQMMRQGAGSMTKDPRASRQKLLSQMRLKVANIEEAVSAVETLVARFEIERRKRTRLVVGPGMVAYDVLKQVESAHQSLRKEGAELQKLTQRFRVQ